MIELINDELVTLEQQVNICIFTSNVQRLGKKQTNKLTLTFLWILLLQNWLLDGFPRTINQAASLDKTLTSTGQPLNLVINLHVPEEVILQRIMGK